MAVLLGSRILGMLFQPEYADATNVFVWLVTAAAITYVASFIGYGLTAAGHFGIQAPLFAAVTLATTLAALVLVPSNGLAGAALAMVIGAVVQLTGSGLILWHVITGKR